MFGVFLVCIWTEYGNTLYLSVFSPNSENTDKKNSEYEHFSQSAFDSHFAHLQKTANLCACLQKTANLCACLQKTAILCACLQKTANLCACLKNLNEVAIATDQNFPGKILIGLTLTR